MFKFFGRIEDKNSINTFKSILLRFTINHDKDIYSKERKYSKRLASN